MTSPYVRPDAAALADVERVVSHLIDELAGWRRRCQKAESELQALKGQDGMVPGGDVARTRGRLLDLERENLDLKERVDRARVMVLQLQERLAFLDAEAPAATP